MKLKRCSRCDQEKSLEDFSRHQTTADRKQNICRSCSSQVGKGYRAKAKAEGKCSYSRRTRLRLKCEVLAFYSHGLPKCACCGEDALEFLSIDHIHGGGSKHRKSLTSTIYNWLKKNGFPEGYRVLCHNCNQSLGNLGYCPHQGYPKNVAEMHDDLGLERKTKVRKPWGDGEK